MTAARLDACQSCMHHRTHHSILLRMAGTVRSTLAACPPFPSTLPAAVDHVLKPSRAQLEGMVSVLSTGQLQPSSHAGLLLPRACVQAAAATCPTRLLSATARASPAVTLYVLPLQPEPEEDKREEEDTHGHVNIEHEVRLQVWGCAWAEGALLQLPPMAVACQFHASLHCVRVQHSKQAPAAQAWQAALSPCCTTAGLVELLCKPAACPIQPAAPPPRCLPAQIAAPLIPHETMEPQRGAEDAD